MVVELERACFGQRPQARPSHSVFAVVETARNAAMYGPEQDAYEAAAALCHKMVKAHPLVDGNKRISWLSARLFLCLNGVRCRPFAVNEAVTMIVGLASSAITPKIMADFFRAHSEASVAP